MRLREEELLMPELISQIKKKALPYMEGKRLEKNSCLHNLLKLLIKQ